MTGSAQRPLLFLDVDGPLIPFGAAPQQYPTYPPTSSPQAEANPLLARINPEHGTRLMTLPCELVWATSWMDDANECIAPRIGFPQLAIVTWPDAPETEQQDERDGLHWKTRTLVAWAAGRPFAWLDDEITDTVRTVPGYPRTIPGQLSFTASTQAEASSSPTTALSRSGYAGPAERHRRTAPLDRATASAPAAH